MNLSLLSRSLLIGMTALSMSGCVIQLDKNRHHRDDGDGSYYSPVTNHNIHNVNDDIRVEAGQKVDVVDSVNGDIHLEDHSQISQASTVNGDIHLRDNVTVSNNLSTVNGTISVASTSQIGGNISTVNGDINIDNARIKHGISTTNGDIHIQGNAIIDGDIRFEKQRNSLFSWGNSNDHSSLEIGPNVKLKGKIVLYHPVKLKLANPAMKDQIEYHDGR